MRNELNVLVGYSDHTEGILVPIAAVAMGGCLIEKHFTLDRKMKGPDHKASLEPLELKKMIDSIKTVSTILGSEIKKPNKSELSMVKAVRKSIVASKDIRRGDVFSQKNLAIKRPGFGLNPKKWNQLLGKRSKENYRNDEMIKANEI
jgi:N,N'-diacetyllegionaminate synthase